MERQRRRPPPARGVGPVMREEDFMVPPDYDRPNRMGLIPGGVYSQSVPNYYTRGDLAPQTMEMTPENRHGAYMEEVRRRSAAPRRLKKGGAVKQYSEGGAVEIEIKVGGRGKHGMPGGEMMEDDMEEGYEEAPPKKKMKAGGKVPKNFIQKAIKKPGALRAQMGVKAGQTIPKAKLAKAAKAPGKLGQRARFAQTLSKMGKK